MDKFTRNSSIYGTQYLHSGRILLKKYAIIAFRGECYSFTRIYDVSGFTTPLRIPFSTVNVFP